MTTFSPTTLRVLDTVTIRGESYVVYQDGQYTHAVTEASWDAAIDGEYEDYTAWCNATTAVGDRALAMEILAECDEALVHVLTCAGSMVQIDRDDLEAARAADIIRDLAAQDAQGFGDGPVAYASGMEALAAWRREAYETGEGEIGEAIDLLGEEEAAEIYEAARA